MPRTRSGKLTGIGAPEVEMAAGFAADPLEEDPASDDDEDFVPEEVFYAAENIEVPAVPVQLQAPPAVRRKSQLKDKNKRHDPPLVWEILEEESERWINLHMVEGVECDLNKAGTSVECVEPSPDIILPLLRFQKEWLAWALQKEESSHKGGILADEMGMGKTIQAISLVLTARALRKEFGDFGRTQQVPGGLGDFANLDCTLVICPVVAVIQWVGEIQRYTREGSVKVLVYHGAKRSSVVQNFSSYDFVLTTYSTVESEYRKTLMMPKIKCKFCGRRLSRNYMKVHLQYHCGPDAVKTEKQAKQVRKMGKRRYNDISVKKDTSLFNCGGKVENDYQDENGLWMGGLGPSQNDDAFDDDMSPVRSPLHLVKWERIILDEAHSIKSRSSNTTTAVCALESTYKWALSGTPLQNRVGELYSLVRFLQVQPYSFFFCRECDCRRLDYPSINHCNECPHSSARHFCWWNKYITKPVQDLQCPDKRERAMMFLRGNLLKSLLLRRTKKGRAADIALPPRIIVLRRDGLDRNEHEFYEALYTQSQIQFDSYLDAGTLMNNYAHIFDLLTRLRQAVDHPYLVIYSQNAGVSNMNNENLSDSCGICHDPLEDPVVTSCGHVFCKECFLQFSKAIGNVSCPSCSKPVTIDLKAKVTVKEQSSSISVKGFKHSRILRKVNLQEFKTSTKIDALREEVRNMIETDLSAKGIVFSQFTSFLDLIGYSLQKSGIKFVQLVGSMTIAEREKAIETFTNDADCKLFLMSLKAGGVALNLTAASHVFLMDPWWNPAVEHQAQDRIHRIGQYKPIRVVKFVIKESIEERILKLQEKKELVFEGTVGDSPAAVSKLTEADLRFLFHN